MLASTDSVKTPGSSWIATRRTANPRRVTLPLSGTVGNGTEFSSPFGRRRTSGVQPADGNDNVRHSATLYGQGPRPRIESVTSFYRRERAALCDLLDRVGPDRPTLCEGWTTNDLAAHLWVRESDPL